MDRDFLRLRPEWQGMLGSDWRDGLQCLSVRRPRDKIEMQYAVADPRAIQLRFSPARRGDFSLSMQCDTVHRRKFIRDLSQFTNQFLHKTFPEFFDRATEQPQLERRLRSGSDS